MWRIHRRRSRGRLGTCRYCKATLQVAARVVLPELAPVAATVLAEPERLARLEEQSKILAKQPPVHPGLATVLEKDQVPSWRTQEAFAVWQSLRTRARSEPVAADDLSHLTGRLCSGLDSEPERQRALLESTLEALVLPRHRQLVLGALVEGAMRADDQEAARRWLARMDSSLDDLAADSAYRLSRALVATARKDWADVLAVLDAGKKGVPLGPGCAALATLLRGNAHLGLGDERSARSVLQDVDADVLAERAARFPRLFSAGLIAASDKASRAGAVGAFVSSLLFLAAGVGLLGLAALTESYGPTTFLTGILAFFGVPTSLLGIFAVLVTAFSVLFGGPKKRT